MTQGAGMRGQDSHRTWIRLLVALLMTSVLLTAQQTSGLSVDAAARSVQPGEVVRLTISTGTPADTVGVSVFDVQFPAFQTDATTWQALVGVDLDVTPGTHRVSVVSTHGGETRMTTRRLTVRPKTFPTRRLTVEPRYVEPPPEVTARIVEEARRLNAIWASRSPARLWQDVFVPPVPDAANSAFGSRSVFNGQPRSPHGGADFRSPTGRVVRSPNAGRVVLAEDLYYTGQSVVVDHGLGLISLFAHLSAIDVAVGTDVTTGDALGKVGATGRVTGPHLHWTVRLAGTRVDPLSLIDVTALPASAISPDMLP